MDYKRAAAGDHEDNTKRQPKSVRTSSGRNTAPPSTDFVKQALFQLETFTGKVLTKEETELWKERLSKYSRDRLLTLNQYTGALNNEVFDYLDKIRLPEQQHDKPKELPPPWGKEMAEDFMKHVELIKAAMIYVPKHRFGIDPVAFEQERQEVIKRKAQIERDGLLELHRKYPTAGFDKAAEKVKI